MKIIKQLSVFIENRTGRIDEVTRILAARGINMSAFSLAESADFGILRMIVSDVEAAHRALKEAHFGVNTTDVLHIACPDQPGAMHRVLEVLAGEGVFIEYMYAFSEGAGAGSGSGSGSGSVANVIIRPTDVARAAEILDGAGI